MTTHIVIQRTSEIGYPDYDRNHGYLIPGTLREVNSVYSGENHGEFNPDDWTCQGCGKKKCNGIDTDGLCSDCRNSTAIGGVS